MNANGETSWDSPNTGTIAPRSNAFAATWAKTRTESAVSHISSDPLNGMPIIREALEALSQKQSEYWKVLRVAKLSGGLTNTVVSLETERWTYVLKTGEWLDREKAFFAASENMELVPKMLEFFEFGNQQAIVMEYKSWINGKEAFDKIQNWERIWKQMGSVLLQLHADIHSKTPETRNEAIRSVSEYLSWGNESSDIAELEKIFRKKQLDIVSLHGDFSPHNCLFLPNESWEYELSAVFDPSGRIARWPAIFDIFYALNNRWIKDRESFGKWFSEGYGPVDFESEEFRMLSKVFSKYLKTLYAHMETKEAWR